MASFIPSEYSHMDGLPSHAIDWERKRCLKEEEENELSAKSSGEIEKELNGAN